MTKVRRLAIVATHPIQHFVALYKALAEEPSVAPHVLFGTPLGAKPYFDAQMQTEIGWKMDLLGGYSHEFLSDQISSAPRLRSPNSPQLGARLAAFAPDAVLTYGYAQANAIRAILWATSHRVPLLMTGDAEREFRAADWRSGVKAVALPFLYRRFAAFLSVGDRNEAYHRHYGATPDRIFRSPFTIDEPSFRAAAGRRDAARAALLSRIGAPVDARLVLYVGKLYEGKRPADLLKALAECRRKPGGEVIHAVFAGGGEQADMLRERARAEGLNAHFLGFINVDALPDIYAAADLLAIPSAIDRHPLVCSEAACVGLPMVISDRVGAIGPTDIARPDENALVYRCGDIAAMASALRMLALDDERRSGMARRGREIFAELDTTRSVQGVLEALDAVCR